MELQVNSILPFGREAHTGNFLAVSRSPTCFGWLIQILELRNIKDQLNSQEVQILSFSCKTGNLGNPRPPFLCGNNSADREKWLPPLHSSKFPIDHMVPAN